MTAVEVTVIIGVVTTSLVTIINTVASHWGHDKVVHKLEDAESDRKEMKDKLNTVNDNTNGRLTAANNRIAELEGVVKTLNLLVEKRRPIISAPTVEGGAGGKVIG